MMFISRNRNFRWRTIITYRYICIWKKYVFTKCICIGKCFICKDPMKLLCFGELTDFDII